MELLNKINSPADLKLLKLAELPGVCDEVRELIIDTVDRNGGHLASNLGSVELSVALHYASDFSKDRLIFDVSHQIYAHKILTGRRDEFPTVRTHDGLLGFASPAESDYDLFYAGHGGSGISTGLGLAVADARMKRDNRTVVVIGDSAIGEGMAFEAMNHAGELDPNMLVVLNDNRWGISGTTGALTHYLNHLRSAPLLQAGMKELKALVEKVPSVNRMLHQVKDAVVNNVMPGHIFENLGFRYFGPVDGHDVKNLVGVFEELKKVKGVVLLHVATQKGKGYHPASENPGKYHAPPVPFLPKSQDTSVPTAPKKESWSAAFGKNMCRIAENNNKLVAITAAMVDGTGLVRFQGKFPDRFYDTGMAEQHAVGFAAGLVKGGLRPVVAIYSTFLQRAFDQVFHEVGIQDLHPIFCLDRAGIAGMDGFTHNGVFDIAYLRMFPNIVLMAPRDGKELAMMMDYAVADEDHCYAIRYPRGSVPAEDSLLPNDHAPITFGKVEELREGQDVTLLAYGSMVLPCMQAAALLKEKNIEAKVVNARFAKPLDKSWLIQEARRTPLLFTVEEHQLSGGFGSAVLETLAVNGEGLDKVRCLGIPDQYIRAGDPGKLLAELGLDAAGIATSVETALMPVH